MLVVTELKWSITFRSDGVALQEPLMDDIVAFALSAAEK